MESFVSVQRQINSLASVALQDRRGLGLFTVEKGRTCLFLGDDCCYFVNETGVVQGRVRELRDRIKCSKKELQNRSTPQSLFQTGPPLVAPFLGTIGTYHLIPVIWTLFLQYLSKVSPRPDLGPLSSPSQDHSPSQEPHLNLRKRRPWALGQASITDPELLPLPSRK